MVSYGYDGGEGLKINTISVWTGARNIGDGVEVWFGIPYFFFVFPLSQNYKCKKRTENSIAP